jgi:Raf kinase inhibitor-like YbhB/YbcL family protein
MPFTLRSSVFQAGGAIPRRYTCQGEDVSVPLEWDGAPDKAKSFALIVDDSDAPDPAAPRIVWTHWLLYNIPADAKILKEAVKPNELPPGTLEGLNDWKRTGYGGPCPPIGRHRYFHKLYALDTLLPDLGEPNKGALERAMQGHIVAQAELIGTYQKQ